MLLADAFGLPLNGASNPLFGEQRRAQIALAEIGQDDDDQFAGVFRTMGHLHGGDDRGAATDADKHPLFARQTPGHGERIVASYLDDFIDNVKIEVARNEARANSLNGMPARRDWLSRFFLRNDRT